MNKEVFMSQITQEKQAEREAAEEKFLIRRRRVAIV